MLENLGLTFLIQPMYEAVGETCSPHLPRVKLDALLTWRVCLFT